MTQQTEISISDRKYIDQARGGLILRVVLTHLGMSWFFLPYSSFVGIFFPSLFCISGIVAYYSFLRSKNMAHFLSRRLAQILITFYIISGFAYLVLFSFTGFPDVSVSKIISWLLINVKISDQPYYMDQIWFLRSLFLATLFSLPIYYLSKRSIHFLLLPVFVSIALATSQHFYPTGKMFWVSILEINPINFYQPLVNIGYFCFGAWAIFTGNLKNIYFNLFLICSGIIVAAILFFSLDFNVVLGKHSFYQDLYYVALGYTGIGIVFILQRPITFFLNRLNSINSLLLFFSYHAFSIYLIHSFYIVFAEKQFGWVNSAAPSVIIPKILFVLIASSLTAIPASYVCKIVTKSVVKFIDQCTLKKQTTQH